MDHEHILQARIYDAGHIACVELGAVLFAMAQSPDKEKNVSKRISKLDKLAKAAAECQKSCNDHSCVYGDRCGGAAGHAFRDYCYKLEARKKARDEDRPATLRDVRRIIRQELRK